MLQVHKSTFFISVLALTGILGSLLLAQETVLPVAAQAPTPTAAVPARVPVVQPSSVVTETFGSATLGGRQYSIAVLGAGQNYVPADSSARPPKGSKWILVAANLNNLDGEAVTVSAGSLLLVDEEGNRYTPDPPDEQTQPALVGASLPRGKWLLGLARYQVPEGTIGKALEWCPGDPAVCTWSLTSPIP